MGDEYINFNDCHERYKFYTQNVSCEEKSLQDIIFITEFSFEGDSANPYTKIF